MRTLVLAALVSIAPLAACAAPFPDHVELLPQAEDVEIAVEPPSPNAYRFVGQVTGRAAANDPDVASQAAKNDLRNKAAALGATIVTLDEDVGEPVLLLGKTKVTVTGRAYRAVE